MRRLHLTVSQRNTRRDYLNAPLDTLTFAPSVTDNIFNVPFVNLVTFKLTDCPTDEFPDQTAGAACAILVCTHVEADLINTALEFYAASQVSSAAP